MTSNDLMRKLFQLEERHPKTYFTVVVPIPGGLLVAILGRN